MIKSLLVANRGEIACRIFRTARQMNIRTVAVYSDADAHARHVREADQAVWIGPPPARDSYLEYGALLAARVRAGGRGHSSRLRLPGRERRVRGRLHRRRLHLRRPARGSIARHGFQDPGARHACARPACRCCPGYAGGEQDLAHLGARSARPGLPLIVKPAAGGGGKGMQIVRREAEIAPALAAARRLAESAFGDGALLLERYLRHRATSRCRSSPTAMATFVHLGERDCSIQRRHQKLIEEAPAPQLPAEVRERLRAAALIVARAVDYVGAGTVEFLYDAGEFYFMEMNTRLQVEHTVTEAITGLDLVEWQLRVAAGEMLPAQTGTDPLSRACDRGARLRRGSAARLPAERRGTRAPGVARGRARAGGCRLRQRGPRPGDLRLASRQGDRLGADARAGGRARSPRRSMPPTAPASTATSTGSRACCAMSASWACSTASPSSTRPAASLRPRRSGPPPLILAALAQLLPPQPALHAISPWAHTDGFTPNLPDQVTLRFSTAAHTHQVELQFQEGRPRTARVDGGTATPLHEVSRSGTQIAARLGAQRLQARVFNGAARVHLWTPSEHLELALDDPRTQQFESSAASGGLTTPLPGVVVSVPVKVGDEVQAGAVVMLIEAMKMEHAITAPHAGAVTAIHFAAGERVSEGSQLLEIAPRA